MRMSFIFAFFLFIPSFAFAQVVINEVAWMGIPIEGVDAKQWWRYEFLELHNTGEQDVSLQGWKVGLYSGEVLEFTILLYGILPAKEYFLVGASDKISGVNVNYATLSGKFKNSGQRVVLKDAAGMAIEELDAQQGWLAGDNDIKLTMERRFADRPAADPENWGSSASAGGTPKSQNSMFGKEAFLKLDSLGKENPSPPTGGSGQEKDPIWVPFFEVVTNGVFIRASLVALLSVVGILGLRRYLLGGLSRDEDSFGVLKD